MTAKKILISLLALFMLFGTVSCSNPQSDITLTQAPPLSENTLTSTSALTENPTETGFLPTETNILDMILSKEDMKLYNNSYDILYNRITDRGYAITSLTGTYVGMFSRDSAIQAMAHLSYNDSDSARAILKYLLSYHAALGLNRTTHIIDNIKDEEYRNNYLTGKDGDHKNYYQSQEDPGKAQFLLNAPNNAAATPFISNKSSIDSIQVYLEGTAKSEVIAEIYTDISDPDTLVATGSYKFTDNKASWKTIYLENSTTFNPNTTYYLKLYAPTDSGRVVWYGIDGGKSGYLKSWNYDKNAYGGNGWREVGVYCAFIIGESDSQITEKYLISQRKAETAIYIINAPNNRAAQAFIPKNKLIYGVEVNLSKTHDTDTVKVMICTDYKDKNTVIAEKTFTFGTGQSTNWQTVTFDAPVSVDIGKTYYLVLEATANSGKVVWYGTTSSCGSLSSYNYDFSAFGGWEEKPYYPAFEIICFNSDTIVEGFEARGNKLSEIDITVNASKSIGKIKAEIRKDYQDPSTAIANAEIKIDKIGEKKYTLVFENGIGLNYEDYYYIVISFVDTEKETRVMTDTKTAADSYYYDNTWHRVGFDFLVDPNFDVDKDVLITINQNTAGIQEISCNGETITSVSVFLSKDKNAKGEIKATLYKGYGDTSQLIDSKKINISEISETADWVNFKFDLPLFQTSKKGNYYIKLESDDTSGNIYWCGSTTVDNFETLIQENGTINSVKGEAGFEAYRSEIKLISDYTQTDANYMLIHAWVMYVNNNNGTEEDRIFIEQSYPIIKKFANYYLDNKQYYNSKMDLLLNPSLEHSRKIRYWVSYDLLTNVFASQALYELSDVAKKMNDESMSSKWISYAEKIKEGINKHLITEIDGKKIYGEFYDVEDGMKFYAGISWVNFAPVAAEWYGMDMDIMKNTYDIYKKYASIKMYGISALATEATLGTNELTRELIGKGIAWELMFCNMIGDTERIEEIVALELKTAKRNNISVYPEFWKSENYVTDPGNQEHCSWQFYAMSRVFPNLIQNKG